MDEHQFLEWTQAKNRYEHELGSGFSTQKLGGTDSSWHMFQCQRAGFSMWYQYWRVFLAVLYTKFYKYFYIYTSFVHGAFHVA